MIERKNEAFEFDEKLTVVGKQLQPGDQAPNFTLDYFDGKGIKQIGMSDSKGKVRLLNVVNSLDTPVCQVETCKWEKMRSDWPKNVEVLTISVDLPFAISRWQQQEKIKHLGLSAHKSEKFGQDYGVLLKEWRMLQRAVFVIDGTDKITYSEYIADQMQEPNYEAAFKATDKALS